MRPLKHARAAEGPRQGRCRGSHHRIVGRRGSHGDRLHKQSVLRILDVDGLRGFKSS